LLSHKRVFSFRSPPSFFFFPSSPFLSFFSAV
jgi:hypothetical protein